VTGRSLHVLYEQILRQETSSLRGLRDTDSSWLTSSMTVYS